MLRASRAGARCRALLPARRSRQPLPCKKMQTCWHPSQTVAQVCHCSIFFRVRLVRSLRVRKRCFALAVHCLAHRKHRQSWPCQQTLHRLQRVFLRPVVRGNSRKKASKQSLANRYWQAPRAGHAQRRRRHRPFRRAVRRFPRRRI